MGHAVRHGQGDETVCVYGVALDVAAEGPLMTHSSTGAVHCHEFRR